MYGYEAKVLKTLAANNITPDNEYTGEQLERLEYDMRSNLEDIVRRAQELIKNIDEGCAEYAATRIADSAGASGPINSTYAKLIGQAAEMNTLIRYATTREVK
jgi:methionine synthase I (cobalamin-dependent)